jgi:hypothetical protein
LVGQSFSLEKSLSIYHPEIMKDLKKRKYTHKPNDLSPFLQKEEF